MVWAESSSVSVIKTTEGEQRLLIIRSQSRHKRSHSPSITNLLILLLTPHSFAMPSMSTSSPVHIHDLHIVIPSTSARAPPTHATPVAEDTWGHGHENIATPLSLDQTDPTHSHDFFRVLDQSSTTHSHGLFRDASPVADADDSHITHNHAGFRVPSRSGSEDAPPPSPTSPRASAPARRRSSLFVSTEDRADPPQIAVERTPLGGAQHFLLGPTSELQEPTTAEVDGSFEKGAAQNADEHGSDDD
ncbi:hypothetical protein C8Q80DRAFT_250942 [Daedaleopsis nitida]|nr:hypothetical protein C8Q80DRAFT_250942 [Daedaleopsis nitida]